MRSLRLAFVALIMLIVNACGSATAKPTKQISRQTHVVCGVIDSIRSFGPMTLYQDASTTKVFFGDDRTLTMIGTPEITVSKGDIYGFRVEPVRTNGTYPLVKTYRNKTCDGTEVYPDDTDSNDSTSVDVSN